MLLQFSLGWRHLSLLCICFKFVRNVHMLLSLFVGTDVRISNIKRHEIILLCSIWKILILGQGLFFENERQCKWSVNVVIVWVAGYCHDLGTQRHLHEKGFCSHVRSYSMLTFSYRGEKCFRPYGKLLPGCRYSETASLVCVAPLAASSELIDIGVFEFVR